MVFPVVMYGCESWTAKNAERRRIDAFELWCWGRLLRVPWTARRSNQSILKEISPGCSLEGLCWGWNSNILATSCKELTHWKRPWWWEGLGAGGEGDDRGWDGWMASLTQWTWVWVNSGSWCWTGRPGVLRFTGSQRVGHDWATELTDWHINRSFKLTYLKTYTSKLNWAIYINIKTSEESSVHPINAELSLSLKKINVFHHLKRLTKEKSDDHLKRSPDKVQNTITKAE